MKAEPATSKRSCSKRSQRELSYPTNHDLLRLINNRAGKSKSSLGESHPEPSKTHQKSRPSLIERKHHENLPQQANQEAIVKMHSMQTLFTWLDRLLSEQDLLPTGKRKLRETMGELQVQLASGSKRLEKLIEAESNSKLNEDKLMKDLTRLQKKIDCNRQVVRKLEQEKDNMQRKIDDLQCKLETQTKNALTPSTHCSNQQSHNSSVHNVSVSGSLTDEKKLRGIMLGQSHVINEQQATIQQHRENLAQTKLHTEQLYQMLLFQASTVESLLPTLNKYSGARLH